MQELLDNLSYHFRSAILAGDYAAAESVATKYVEAIRQNWEALTEVERSVSPLPMQSREVLEWARASIIAQRALSSEQVAVLLKSSRYLQPGSPSIELQA